MVKSEQQHILAAIGMLMVMDEGEFELWRGLYGGKLFKSDAHWDVKYPAKARDVLEACKHIVNGLGTNKADR